MRFAAIDSVILFGGAPLLVATVRHLNEVGLPVHVFTSPRHLAEDLDGRGTTLHQTLQQLKTPYVSTDDINAEPTLPPLIGPGTLGIGMGEAWSFEQKIIDAFGGRLLDFMGIPLPQYRGGAHYTWMILTGHRESACNIQIINADMVQGERDTGELVKTKRYRFPAQARTPMDYFDAAVGEEVAFIQEFIDEIKAGKDFALTRPDEAQSLFFPRLNTLINGWIDWRDDGHEIERLICAFDAPYAGASTRIGTARVHLKGATLDAGSRPYHPYQSGLVVRITEMEGFVIATQSGNLRVRTIYTSKDSELGRPIRVGDRLFTPQADLEAALTGRVHYSAH